MEVEDAWHWMDDDEDHLESLACPVLIEADVLRRLLEEERQVGIKEAVEFINSQARRSGADKYYDSDGSPQLRAIFCPIIFTDEWQAKLKEWGVDSKGG